MNDCEFLRHLQNTGKIEWYVFGSTGMWQIKDTILTLSEKQRLVEEKYGYSSESMWYVKTTRYFIVLKCAEYGTPLEEFWNSLDWAALEKEGLKQNEDFSHTPDW